jgi:hypothetical protein
MDGSRAGIDGESVKKTLFLVAAVAWSGAAQANAFDDCVLENMKAATSDLAAKSIKTACLRKNSVALSQDDLKAITGQISYGSFGSDGEPGFMLDLKNDSPFIVTEVTVAVGVESKASQFFKVDYFWYRPPGVVFTGVPPDPTLLMRIDPHTQKRFQFAGTVPEITPKVKWNWYIAGAKGIVSN